MFVEDSALTDAYLADFGVSCSSGSTDFSAFLDQPDEVIDFGKGAQVSRQYQLTYRPGDIILRSGDAVSIGSDDYTVRHIQQIDDGVFAHAWLNKS